MKSEVQSNYYKTSIDTNIHNIFESSHVKTIIYVNYHTIHDDNKLF
jgi:hypothetical protein